MVCSSSHAHSKSHHIRLTRKASLFNKQNVDNNHDFSFSGHMCGLARTLTKWNDWMEVNGGMTCKPKLPLLFSSHDDLRYSVSPGSCHPLWHRSHRRKSHIWHRRSHGLCDRPWRTLCTHLPHPPSYRCDSGTCRMKRTRTRLCIVHQQFSNNRTSFYHANI